MKALRDLLMAVAVVLLVVAITAMLHLRKRDSPTLNRMRSRERPRQSERAGK